MNDIRNVHGNSMARTLSLQKSIPIIILLLTVGLVGVYLFRPIYDPDFYWHLKTGQWIWQNRSLPHTDLFGVPPIPDLSPRTEFIYTSYWLTQLILYAFYSFGGMSGIILFRWIIVGLSFLVCACWTNVRKSTVAMVLAVGSIQLLEFYLIERPQFVSFVCFGALLVLLFRFFEQRTDQSLWSTLLPLSLLMLIWANMHGGFLIGQAVLVYCLISEGIKFRHCSLLPLSARNYRVLLISAITALFASCIQPNPLNILKMLPFIFDADHYLHANNLEELSLWEYYRENPTGTIFFYGASMVLTLGALAGSTQRKNITWVGILVGTAFMGSQHMRLMPFFLVSALLFMTKYFATECSALKWKLVLIVLLAANAIHGVRDEFPRILEATKSGFVPAYQFPIKAADFIAANNIRGNLYTTMHWGGYMIWRVGPDNKIFYDGRTLSTQRAQEYSDSRIIKVNQRPYWKELFDIYDIRLAVMPIYEDNGEQNMLTQSISADKDWLIIFATEFEAVFVKIWRSKH